MITIDFAIATHQAQVIERLASCELPRIEGVRYIVSWQSHGGAPLPAALRRSDVEVYRFEGVGLSANRNNAIGHCRAEVVAFADDDLEFFTDGIRELQRVYADHPEVDFIIFRSLRGPLTKPESDFPVNLPLPRGFFVTSFEISFRRRCNLRCCDEVGLGSPSGIEAGEDELLLHSALRRGLTCHYFPATVCAHEHPSTGSKPNLTPGNLRGFGCVIALIYNPFQVALRLPLKIWRIWRSGRAGFSSAAINIMRGALAARSIRRRNRSTLW